jgi:glycosyltransferase involved in cell wall biosynthesis
MTKIQNLAPQTGENGSMPRTQCTGSAKRDLKIAIVNRNYPPRVGVTGESACRLARHLETHSNARVTVVSCRSEYAGGGSQLEPEGEVRTIRSLYDGKNKVLRLLSTFVESYLLIRAARSTKPDHVIVMTDPPFLQFWAPFLLSGKCPWTLWSMDLYPDAFVSSKLVKPNNLIYRILKRWTYRKAPDSLIALGPLQEQYLKTAYQEPIKTTAVVPCGVYAKRDQLPPEPAWKTENAGKILLGYCGNLGEAHSVQFLKQVINHFDPKRFHLVLSVYGVKAHEILSHAETKKDGITIVPRVERDQLSFIDIHLVSLKKNWSHVCVPSKAVSAICSGSPILLYGTPDCDNWKMLGFGGWLIRQSSDQNEVSQAVSNFLNSIEQETIESKKLDAASVAAVLRDMVDFGYFQVARNLGLADTTLAEPATTPERQTSSSAPIPKTNIAGSLPRLPKSGELIKD